MGKTVIITVNLADRTATLQYDRLLA